MDGQYYSPQNHLPLSYQYDENEEDLSTQSSLRLFSFDNLPRPQPDHRFMSTPPTSQLLPEPYALPTQISMSQSSQMWNGPIQCSPGFSNQHDSREDYSFEPSGYITANENNDIFARGMNFGEVPRTTWEQYNPRILQDNSMPTYEHSDYMTEEDIKPNLQDRDNENNRAGLDPMDYNAMEISPSDYPPLSLSRSSMQEDGFAQSPMLANDFMSADGLPFDKPMSSSSFRMPSSSLSEDGNHSREMTTVEGEEQGADEPYAKLIYRALMSAPNHSMVLQEIYQWFRDHTVKGSSDSKGWMNSIRHNLSMNAAFKKTERKLSSDDTKKSTEWVLEDFAIKDGVQSTTRYRKGTAASKKFQRSETPAPNRQISGRKGGMSAKNSLRFRHRTPVPRIDTSSGSLSHSTAGAMNMGMSNVGNHVGNGFGSLRRSHQQQQQQFRSTRHTPSSLTGGVHDHSHNRHEHIVHGHEHGQGQERQRSPLTPPQQASPYFFTQKMELGSGAYDAMGFAHDGSGGSLGHGMYGLEDVQGVQIDDSPVFATNHELQYHGFPAMAGHDGRF